MKKRSTIQIIVDHNQNLRINNLQLDELIDIFDDFIGDKNLNSLRVSSISEKKNDNSSLSSDITLATDLYKSCKICFRKCGVNRNENEIGWCGLNSDNNIYMSAILNEEEKIICPTYAIYLSSCNISCEYCHQKHFMQPTSENHISIGSVVDDIKNNLATIKSISFIGGNPDISILTILKIVLSLSNRGIELPLVLNSNFLFTKNLYPIIGKYFDVLIPDFKFWDYECSITICGFKNYSEIVQNNILHFINRRMMIIRHLPLFGHWECCSKPIIDWISKQKVNKDLFFISFLNSLYIDNSKEIRKCVSYAKKLKMNLI